MKHNLTLVIAFFLALVASAAAQDTTLYQRFEFSRGTDPYHVTALFTKEGWEVWAFGDTSRQGNLLDVEVGHPIAQFGKHCTLLGYAVLWPTSNKWFAIPWLNYTGTLPGRADYSLNLAGYLPVNGGPHILFSDGSHIMWRDLKGNGIGMAGFLWNQQGFASTLRLGVQADVVVSKTLSLTFGYQPFYLQGAGNPVFRVESTFKF